MENRITSTTEIETLQTENTLALDELVQQGAKRMLEAALTIMPLEFWTKKLAVLSSKIGIFVISD